jgi:NAD(P)-dependent dehydrogenase (short-subunit alcohol dehydrogenase family)
MTIRTGNTHTMTSKILVLGATGGTGRLIVDQAVARGDDVAVLVRSAEKAKDLKGAKIIVGDARDEAALRQAVKGRDAVVSALGTPAGPFKEVTLLSTATRGRERLAPGRHHGDRRRRQRRARWFPLRQTDLPASPAQRLRRQGPAGSDRQE